MYACPMTMLDATIVDLLSDQADRVATANPPSRVLALVFLGIFTAIGWAAGRFWFYAAKGLVFTVLAVRYGYRQGMKVPVEAVPRQ